LCRYVWRGSNRYQIPDEAGEPDAASREGQENRSHWFPGSCYTTRLPSNLRPRSKCGNRNNFSIRLDTDVPLLGKQLLIH
ncbi:uncharacterized protein MYCFIDRAFT_152463, partial [Pseudocercospora fijiensis CIRAD86]